MSGLRSEKLTARPHGDERRVRNQCVIMTPHYSSPEMTMTQSEFASLTLFRATPAQVHESRKRTWPEWGGLLTEEKYFDREAQLDVMEHAINSRMITW